MIFVVCACEREREIVCVCVCVCVCIDEVDIHVEPAPLMLCSMSIGCEVVFLATSLSTEQVSKRYSYIYNIYLYRTATWLWSLQ